jgi:hypothetical protein
MILRTCAFPSVKLVLTRGYAVKSSFTRDAIRSLGWES